MKWIRKGLLVLCISAMVPNGIACQMTIGVRGGLASATVTGEDLTDTRRRSGITIGGSLGLDLGGPFNLDVGAAYTQKGVAATEGGTDIRINLGYIEFPVLARLTVPTVGGLTSHASIGPVFAFEAGCEAETTQVELTITVDCNDPSLGGDLDTKSFDVGALVGAGVSIGVGTPARVSIDAMYNVGLRSIDASDTLDPNRNRAFMVTWGLSFTIGG